MDPELRSLLEWLLILGVAAWIFLPNLLAALGISYYRNQVSGEPADLDPQGKGPIYADLHEQLVHLGFYPLGLYREQVLARRGRREFIFVHHSEHCVAVIFRLVRGNPRLVLKSYFANGAVVGTCNAYEQQDDANFLVKGVASNAVDVVLEEHRRGVGRFTAAGNKLLDCSTLATYAERERQYFFNPTIRRKYRSAQWTILFAKLLVLAAGAAIVAVTYILFSWVLQLFNL